MKKTALFLAALSLLCASQAGAVTSSKPATPQQTRMKSCAAQYHQKGIAKSQYHAFMSKCLKGNAATSAISNSKPAAAAPNAPDTGQ